MLSEILKLYNPVLNLSLVIVIVNLGMPLDYRLIAEAGLFTAIYIFSRAIGKIGGAYLGGRITKADTAVKISWIHIIAPFRCIPGIYGYRSFYLNGH